MGLVPGTENLQDPKQAGYFKASLTHLRFSDDSGHTLSPGLADRRNATWQEWLVDKTEQAERLNRALAPYFPLLDVELIQLINRVVLSRFTDYGRQLARLEQRDSSVGVFGEPLLEFVSACRELNRYCGRWIPGDPPVNTQHGSLFDRVRQVIWPWPWWQRPSP
jgi:hypothetical protein